MSAEILSMLEAIRRDLAKLSEQTAQPVAVRRAVAAKMMGVSRRKLEQLISGGRVRTAQDAHLVPMAEIKRYCAPKVKRERRPAVGHRARQRYVDGQSDEALDLATRAIRTKAAHQ